MVRKRTKTGVCTCIGKGLRLAETGEEEQRERWFGRSPRYEPIGALTVTVRAPIVCARIREQLRDQVRHVRSGADAGQLWLARASGVPSHRSPFAVA